MIDHIVVSSPPIISAAGRPGTFVHGAAAGVSLSRKTPVRAAGRPAGKCFVDRSGGCRRRTSERVRIAS
jgi:hypothetical protein